VGEKKKMSQDLFKKILRKYKGKLHSQDTMELSDVGIFMLIMFDFFISSPCQRQCELLPSHGVRRPSSVVH
jgi:hypothetical protein